MTYVQPGFDTWRMQGLVNAGFRPYAFQGYRPASVNFMYPQRFAGGYNGAGAQLFSGSNMFLGAPAGGNLWYGGNRPWCLNGAGYGGGGALPPALSGLMLGGLLGDLVGNGAFPGAMPSYFGMPPNAYMPSYGSASTYMPSYGSASTYMPTYAESNTQPMVGYPDLTALQAGYAAGASGFIPATVQPVPDPHIRRYDHPDTPNATPGPNQAPVPTPNQAPAPAVNQAPAARPAAITPPGPSASEMDAKYHAAVVANARALDARLKDKSFGFSRQMDADQSGQGGQHYNEKYWQRVSHNGEDYWEIRPGVKASDAITDAFAHHDTDASRYKVDCAAATNLITMKAKLDTIGADAFNQENQTLAIKGWNTWDSDTPGATPQWHDSGVLNAETGDARDGSGRPTKADLSQLRPGDAVYFANPLPHPDTPSQGENAIYLGRNADGKPQFFGNPIGIITLSDDNLHTRYGQLSTIRGRVDPNTLVADTAGAAS